MQQAPVIADTLPAVYSRCMGHPFAIERFLVVGDDGFVATLKRIPHIVHVSPNLSGDVCLMAMQPADTSEAEFAMADIAYRKRLASARNK